MRNTRQYSVPLAFAYALVGGMTTTFALAGDTTTESQPSNVEARRREPVIGVGYHVGNFIGPLAFDIIVRPLAHIALDIQGGYFTVGAPRRLAFAPHLQWEIWRGLQTPYLALAFRYEKVWFEGSTGASRGGALIGGWQIRWQSGIGLLFGVGVLRMSAIDIRTASAQYYSQGGLFGTYEVGLRYFF